MKWILTIATISIILIIILNSMGSAKIILRQEIINEATREARYVYQTEEQYQVTSEEQFKDYISNQTYPDYGYTHYYDQMEIAIEYNNKIKEEMPGIPVGLTEGVYSSRRGGFGWGKVWSCFYNDATGHFIYFDPMTGNIIGYPGIRHIWSITM